ncbi:hypothetical protein D3C87_1147750 [compost metagenome]
MGIARQHAIQLGRGRVAELDQNHDVGVGLGDGTGDGRHVFVPGPQVGGIEGQGRRAFAGHGAAAREPLGPDGEYQQDRDAQTRNHGGPQAQDSVE